MNGTSAGVGDPTIQGFATDISVNRGSTVSFKISTEATAYRIDIYRLGYYGGRGARKVATINPSVSLPQISRLYSATRRRDWSIAETGRSRRAGRCLSNAVSGVYIARPVGPTPAAPAISSSSYAMTREIPTCSSRHRTQRGTPTIFSAAPISIEATAAVGGRCYKVSYNRPFMNRDAERP